MRKVTFEQSRGQNQMKQLKVDFSLGGDETEQGPLALVIRRFLFFLRTVSRKGAVEAKFQRI